GQAELRRAELDRPLRDVVGVPHRPGAPARGPRGARRGVRRRPGAGRGQGRRGARRLRPRRHARRRRLDGLDPRAGHRVAAGHVLGAAAHGARPRVHAGLVDVGAAPPRGVQQEPRAGVHRGGGAQGLPLPVPVRPLLRVVPAARRGASRDARGARQGRPRLRRRPRQHRAGVRAGRLRVDPRLRGRRARPHRRPHARPARHRRPAPRPRGDPLLHRTARLAGTARHRAAL
ncbi:MAG: Coproheme decarboxylase HemQ (no EC), partial [uncultured Actinomycetospora sp.]